MTRALARLQLDEYAFNMHTTAVAIEFDPDKAAVNLRKHKVSFSHAEQALRGETEHYHA